MTLGLAAFGIVTVAKKQSAAAGEHRTKATRFDRERRLFDWLSGKK